MTTTELIKDEHIEGEYIQSHPTGYVDMTNEEYHSSPGISKSHLDCIAEKSPKHYWQKYINPDREPFEPTPAMQKGSAIHLAILEPDLVDTHMVRGLELERRSNADKAAWAEYEAKHAGKIILKAEHYEHVMRMRDAIHSHPVAAGLFRGGRSEQSVFAHDIETNELIKCRYDYQHDLSMIVDLKKTTDASPAGFGKSASNYRYDVQAAWYYHVTYCAFGVTPESWAFVAIEEEPPYAIGIYFVTHDMIARAHNAAMRDFHRIIELRRTRYFPDYGEAPMPLELPAWAKR